MAYSRIKPKRGTAAQWKSANQILSEGEIGIVVPDTGIGTGACDVKIGDGATRWNNLPYAYCDTEKANANDVLASLSGIVTVKDYEFQQEFNGLQNYDIRFTPPSGYTALYVVNIYSMPVSIGSVIWESTPFSINLNRILNLVTVKMLADYNLTKTLKIIVTILFIKSEFYKEV